MKVVDVSFFYNDTAASTTELLQQHDTTMRCTAALQQNGVDVVVVKRFNKNETQQHSGVQFYFIKDIFKGRLRPWQIPINLLLKIKQLKPDVVQLHGFMFPVLVIVLRMILKKRTAVFIQYHSEPGIKGIKGFLYKRMNNLANGFLFVAKEQALQSFVASNSEHKIMPVMEGSTIFKKYDKTTARNITELTGNPIFIWVGRLNENKDPLTVLNGFEQLLKKVEEAKLYMLYSSEELLQKVTEKINQSAALKAAVHLLGKVPHDKLEAYYNSADYFVLGSHYEGSGYALCEALACGCVPIVTNIPSFITMTNNGKIGALWQPGNSASFVQAAMLALQKNKEKESIACVQFFNQQLSFTAIAQTTIGYYKTAIHKQTS